MRVYEFFEGLKGGVRALKQGIDAVLHESRHFHAQVAQGVREDGVRFACLLGDELLALAFVVGSFEVKGVEANHGVGVVARVKVEQALCYGIGLAGVYRVVEDVIEQGIEQAALGGEDNNASVKDEVIEDELSEQR